MNAIVGPNNSGKSNLVRALRMALDPEYKFTSAIDVPGQRLFAFPRVTLTFHCSGVTSREKTLLRYLDTYEASVTSSASNSYASKGTVRLVVTFRGNQHTNFARQEYFAARGGGDRRGNPDLNTKAIDQFRSVVQLVAIDSGQNIEQLLASKFRESLSQILRAELRNAFADSAEARDQYIEVLKAQLLEPMRGRVLEITKRLFPELSNVNLAPSVPELAETLSDISIYLHDSVETKLEDKGTGVAGGVLIALLRYMTDASRESLIFAIEEPETFLHPAAQEFLRDDLEALAERESVSLLITTHSPFIISRSPKAQIIAIAKDNKGASTIAGTAAGSEAQARTISGLFRDNVIPELLDRSNAIPRSAVAVLLVEGQTDADFIRIACRRLAMNTLLEKLHIVVNTGVNSVVAQAVILQLEAKQSVWVLLDSDENGRKGKDMLIGRFNFNKRDVFEYRQFTNLQDSEAEWLFPATMMEMFVSSFGEDVVLKSKVRVGGEFRYDFTPVGKEQFPRWLEENGREADFAGWRPLLGMLSERIQALT